jgi:hypothetical protein
VSRVLLLYRSYVMTAVLSMLASSYIFALIGRPLQVTLWTLATLATLVLVVYAFLVSTTTGWAILVLARVILKWSTGKDVSIPDPPFMRDGASINNHDNQP